MSPFQPYLTIVIMPLMWLMIIPPLMQVDFASIGKVGGRQRSIVLTFLINWLVRPFSLWALAEFFVSHVFAHYLPADPTYIGGIIMMGAAPCGAMAFVWSNLSDGDLDVTRRQVALNSAIMMFAFIPLVGLLLGLSGIEMPWQTLAVSAALYIVVPAVLAQIIRRGVLWRMGPRGLTVLLARLRLVSQAAFLTTLVLLLDAQGDAIMPQPYAIMLLAVPILVQMYFTACLAYLLNRMAGEAHCMAGPSTLIGVGTSFEIAAAVAISIFGLSSGAVLAIMVGVLIEVPVMLLVVSIINASRGWYELGSAVMRNARIAEDGGRGYHR